MVKFIATKRSSKKETKQEPRVEEKVIRHFHLEEKVDKRHRFKTTKQERDAIDINLQRRIEDIHIETKTDISGCYFRDIIELKRSAMGIVQFQLASILEKKFMSECYGYSQSLPLVLANLSSLLKIAYFYLKEKSSKSLVLETLPYLIKDCREEFYPYLNETIKQVLSHIQIDEVEHLEKSFLFIAYAMKYLEKVLIQNFEQFAELLQEQCFNSPYNIIKKLASEALGFLIRKNRNLITRSLTLEYRSLSYAIYVSIQSIKGYLSQNCFKVIDEVWKTNQQLINQFYITLINQVTETPHQSAKIMISLYEVFQDLKKRTTSIDQNILIELFKNHKRKVTPLIMMELVQFIESPEVIGNAFRIYNSQIEDVLVSNAHFVNMLLNIGVQELQQITEIILQQPNQKRPITYKLLVASTFKQLFQQNEQALQILLQLDEIHCIDKLTPDQIDQLCNSELFNRLLTTTDNAQILFLCKLIQMVELPQKAHQDVISQLENQLTRLNIQSEEQIDYNNNNIEKLSGIKLELTNEVQLLFAEQNQNNKSLEDGIIIRILQIKGIPPIQLNRNIHNLFSRLNLQTQILLQLCSVPKEILEIGLMSRKRQVRLICAQKLNEIEQSDQLQLMIDIDSEKVNLDNERRVKSSIINLKNMINKSTNLVQIERFAYGLAFTKFLLVRQTIKELLSTLLPKCSLQSVLRIFLINKSEYQKNILNFIEKFCYLQVDDEQLDSQICFDEVFASAMLNSDFNVDTKKILHQISFNYLENEMQQDLQSTQIEQFYKRRYGDRTQLFHLKMLNSSQHLDIFKHWLLKDDEHTQMTALNNIKSVEIQNNLQEFHNVINEFFTSMEQLINGNTFKGEVIRFQLEMPENMQKEYKKYILHVLYPKVFSKQKLHKKKHKNAAIQVRRNAVFEQLSNLNMSKELIQLIMDNHGFLSNDIVKIPIQIKIQFLKIIKNLIEKFGYQIDFETLSDQIFLIRKILNEAYLLKQQETVGSLTKELWKVAIKRLCQIVNKYHSELKYTEMIQSHLQECLKEDGFKQGFEKIVQDSRSQASGMLKLLQSVSRIEYFGFLERNHELMLCQFFNLYDFTYIKQIHIGEDDDGRLAHQLKKDISKKITSQRNNIQILNAIIYQIFQLTEPSTTVEIEQNELSITFTQNYGEKLLQCLINNIKANIDPDNQQIKDINIVFLVQVILTNKKEFSTQLLNECLELFSKSICNPKLYDSQIHNHNLMGKLINNCVKIILEKVTNVEYDVIIDLFDSYSSLLITVKNLSTRNLLVDVIITMTNKFSQQYPLVIDTILLLKNMNFRNQITEEIEFDKCLDACLQFQKLIQEDRLTTELILQNCFFLLTSSELSIRVAVQEIFKGYLHSNIESKYITTRFLPQLIQLIKNNDEISVKGAFIIFEHYLHNISIDEYTQAILNNQPLNMIDELYDSKFCEFKVIFEHSDPNQNVFNLLFDIQLTKRIKGMQLIEKRITELPVLLIQSVSKLMLPLLDFYIFYASGELNNSKHKLTDANKSHYHTLQDLSISIYGYICGHFDFQQRITIMQQLTKKLEKSMMSNKIQLSQAAIKTITALALNKDQNYNVVQLIKDRLQNNKQSQLEDYIQQFVSIEDGEQNEQMIDFEFSYRSLIQQEKELAKAREIKDVTNQFWNQVVDITTDEIQEWQDRSNVLLKQVYIPLKNLFLLDEKHRLLLSTALTELIVQLPPEHFMLELNRLVGRLCRLLKIKDNDQREEIRRCLLELSKKIGPTFLKFIVTQMKANLNQGFENHVLSYTLGMLVEQITQVGAIDNCLEEILEIFLDEVFGRLCSEKETESLPKKTKEIKSKKGMGHFKLIGSLLNFINSLPKVIGIIDFYITQYQISHNLQSKLKLVFEHLYLGLMNNESVQNVTQVVYLMICETSHKLAEKLKQSHNLDFTYNEKHFKKVSKEDIMTIQLPSYGDQSIMQYMKSNKLKTSSTIIFGLVNFISIKLLHHHIQTIEDSPLVQKMFTIILDCLHHKDMITESVSVLTAMIRKFEWVTTFKKQLIQNTMQCLSAITSTDEQFIRDTFLLLKAILDSKLNEFTLPQQKTLIHFIDLYIESNEALECLRIIINQVWPLPQIYDLIMKIRESMLQTTKKTQHLNQSIYINFLIKYPLSSQVLQQHYDFILANLQYKYFTGRQIIYQCLQQIFQFFPEETVNKLSEISFFSLVVALIKEDVQILKDQLTNVLTTLISRTPQDKLMKLTSNALTWMVNDKVKVCISGIESLYILKDHIKYYSSRFIAQVVNLIDKCHENWNEWKNSIQAKNIQNKNLKNSKWANELEMITISLYPELQEPLYGLLRLLNAIDEHHLISIFEQQTLCKLFKFISYPHQETANQAILLLIRSQNFKQTQQTLINQEDILVNNMHKIVKQLFLIKFIRNQVIVNQELTFQLIFDYLNVMKNQQSVIESFFDNLLKITSNLMAKQSQLNKGIINLIEFYSFLINNQYILCIQAIESIARIQTLNFDLPLISQVFLSINQILQQIEKQLGAQEFIKIYSQVTQTLSKRKAEKKIEQKILAVKDPEQYQQKRERKMKTKRIQKKRKLLEKRGKIVLE